MISSQWNYQYYTLMRTKILLGYRTTKTLILAYEYLQYLGIIPPVHEIPDAVVVLPHGVEGVGHLNKTS
jgi:hypothetical protein